MTRKKPGIRPICKQLTVVRVFAACRGFVSQQSRTAGAGQSAGLAAIESSLESLQLAVALFRSSREPQEPGNRPDW